jgi:hypothetical protein
VLGAFGGDLGIGGIDIPFSFLAILVIAFIAIGFWRYLSLKKDIGEKSSDLANRRPDQRE